MKLVKFLFPIICIILLFGLFCIAETPIIIGLLLVPGIMVGAVAIYDTSVVTYSMYVILLMGLIYCLLLVPFFVAYTINSSLVYLLVSFFLISLIVTFLTNRIIKLGENFGLIIFMRKLAILSIFLTLVVLSVIVGIGVFRIDFPFWMKTSCIVALFVHIALMWRLVKEATRNLYIYSNCLKPNYILYLRRFSFDDSPKDRSALSSLLVNTHSLRVMKIGNPSKFWNLWTDYSCIYLQSTNWQDMLHDYIDCARLVFIQVEVSDGVIWEIFKNIEYREKYIYHIAQMSSLYKIIFAVHSRVEESFFKIVFKKFLIFVFKAYKSSTNELTFIIDNDRILFSKEITPILDLKMTNVMSDKILPFNIQDIN